MVTRDDLNEDYPRIGIVLEMSIGCLVCCVCGLALFGYWKVHAWRKPSGLVVMHLLAVDILNGFNGFIHVAALDCTYRRRTCSPDIFHTAFFFQSFFLWVSTQIILLLNVSRLIAITFPFQYLGIVSKRSVRIALALIYVSGLANSLIRRYVPHLATDMRIYGSFVILQIVQNVVILGLAGLSLYLLRSSADEINASRLRATKTVFVVSAVYFLTYGYYQYASIVYMIPGLIESDNVWIWFTATGPLALSLGHLFLLTSSLFNGAIFFSQPDIKAAIQNIWVRNYYRQLVVSESETY